MHSLSIAMLSLKTRLTAWWEETWIVEKQVLT